MFKHDELEDRIKKLERRVGNPSDTPCMWYFTEKDDIFHRPDTIEKTLNDL